ncbi:MAG: AfsR/SARP family transcriptional regulator [Chloroflexota bacterium]
MSLVPPELNSVPVALPAQPVLTGQPADDIQRAEGLVHRLLAEQQAVATAISRLLGAVEEQTRMAEQLTAALCGGNGRAPAVAPPTFVGHAPQDGHRVAVFCLGTFELLIDGVRVQRWRSGKTRALFQLLANHHGRPVPRETLIGALWPNPEAVAGTSLKVAIHALRQTLAQFRPGRAAKRGASGQPASETSLQPALTVLAHESGYQLNGDEVWLDVDEFERAGALGRRLEVQRRDAEALALYARAADLYRGDFLADSWDDWVVFRREALKDQYLYVVAKLADAALAAADYQGCILRCQQLLAQDRCREDTYRTLMLCHARLSQRDRVRSWYDLCVRTLRIELDSDPEPETEDLYHRAMRNGHLTGA